MLGVFLLLAFTHVGHKCQDLLNPCDGMHMYTDLISVHTLMQKSSWGMESESMLTPREKYPLLEAQSRFERHVATLPQFSQVSTRRFHCQFESFA